MMEPQPNPGLTLNRLVHYTRVSVIKITVDQCAFKWIWIEKRMQPLQIPQKKIDAQFRQAEIEGQVW